MLNVATPEPFSIPTPIWFGPSLKITLPVGVPEPGDTAPTVAENVTVCPKLDGLSEELTDVEVLAWFTVCETPVDVLLAKLKFVSPLYVAVIVFGEPTVVEVRLQVPADTVPVQVEVPSLTVTVSVPGTPPPVEVTL